jgi:glutathione S-transferase
MRLHLIAGSPMPPRLTLISHRLCPYVQRAVIALTEKDVAFERVDIDLVNKPDWFLKVSPLGRTPVLQVGETAIFESAVILEYLEETEPKPLHPADPLRRAEHRGWIEFGSAVLNDIAGFYSASDEAAFKAKGAQLEARFARLEARVVVSPWFDGDEFSLVDAVFGPVFRYFEVFDEIGDFGVLENKPRLARWRAALAARPSVKSAVSAEYPALLRDFLNRRNAWISQLQAGAVSAA